MRCKAGSRNNVPPTATLLGLRYTRAKKRQGFVSFISLASMIGIALGVAVLITVLSVMNGFDAQLKKHFFSVAPEITVVAPLRAVGDWQHLAAKVERNKAVTATAPYAASKAMLSYDGEVAALNMVGILPQQESKITSIGKHMTHGSLLSLKQHDYNIVIGQKLAEQYGIHLGDKLIIIIPQANTTPLGIIPRYRQFHVSGIFHTGAGFGFEDSVAFINYYDAQALLKTTQATAGLHVKVNDVYAAPQIAAQLQHQLPFAYLVSDWTQQFGAFFQALGMEKNMMFLILLLIVAVAAFNLVSTLVMVVNDKRADIAILRTLGFSRRQILLTFIIQGAIVGLIGTLLGVLLGIILALNATEIAAWLQQVFGVQFVSSKVYMINFLPSKLQLSDVVSVGILAWLLSLLATLYPAWLAFRTQPAEALRYE